MERDELLKVMTFSLRVGEVMLESSVATSEVEEAVRRLTAALGLDRCEVSVTLDVVTLCYLDSSMSNPITLVKVVDLRTPRLDRLVDLHQLSRGVESGEIDLEKAAQEIERLGERERTHRRWATFSAGLVSAAAWVLFAGGGLIGACAGALAAAIIALVVTPLSRSRIPAVFATAAGAAVAVAVPSGFAWAEIPIALTPTIVGGLYPLLPGGALVASVTDGLSGAPISSMAKGLQATFSAAALALGAIGVLTLSDHLGISSDTTFEGAPAILLAVAAGVAVAALAVARDMPFRFAPSTALIAMAAWGVAQVGTQPSAGFALNTFLAASLVGLSAQIVARLQHTSATIYTTTAVYVLVPGFAFYLTMVAFAQGDTDTGTDLLVRTLGVSVAIAAGIALGVAIGRSVRAPRPRATVWNRAENR